MSLDFTHPYVDPTSIDIAITPPPAVVRDDVSAMPTARSIVTVTRPSVIVDPTPTIETPTQNVPVAATGYKASEGQYGGATSEVSPNIQTLTPAVVDMTNQSQPAKKNYTMYIIIAIVIIAALIWYFKYKK